MTPDPIRAALADKIERLRNSHFAGMETMRTFALSIIDDLVARSESDEAAIRADERERCAKTCDQIRNNAERRAAEHENGEARNSALDKMEGAIQCAAAIRRGE